MKKMNKEMIIKSFTNIQRIFDVAVTIDSSLNNDKDIVNYYFIRTGERLNINKLREEYNKILRISEVNNYSRPLDFLKDNFSEHLENTNLNILKINRNGKTISKIHINEIPEDKNSSEERVIKKTKINIQDTTTIPNKIRNRILKYKKNNKYYREMDQRSKELDNKLDYFTIKSKNDENGGVFYDNRILLSQFSLLNDLLEEVDTKFREVISRICQYDKTQVKNKQQWKEDALIIKNYVEEKLNKKEPDFSTKRLASTIGHLMKCIQLKIFEIEDRNTIEELQHLKMKLCFFYNFYRK